MNVTSIGWFLLTLMMRATLHTMLISDNMGLRKVGSEIIEAESLNFFFSLCGYQSNFSYHNYFTINHRKNCGPIMSLSQPPPPLSIL